MAEIAEKYSDFVIVTTDNSRNESKVNIIKDIIKGFSDKKNYKVIPSRKDAIEYAVINADVSDIILIVGKGHERYNIDKDGYHIFDERDIIKNSLKLRKDYKKIIYENHSIHSSDIK
jgi:UDP-N-acetylmuramoyl-L-alanyl-D-glutamate--2,6-diaminopimelate ligase